MVVTSASVTEHAVTTALVTAGASTARTLPRRAAIPNGAGDLFAGLLLGRMLNGETVPDAFANGLSDLDAVLQASEHKTVLDLSALSAGSA